MGLDVGSSSSGFCKSSVSEEKDTWKVIYSNEPGLDTLGVQVLVPSEKAGVSKECASMLLQEFKWSKFSAVAVPAKLNGQMVVAIVNTGSAGVVISKSCFDWLGLVSDNEVEFTITLATDTNKKVRKVMFGVEVTVGDKTVRVPAIVLEGLHFDVLLGVSWLHEAKASIQVSEGSLVVDTVKIPYKLWPEPAAFVVEEGVCVYCNKLTVIRPGRSVGVPVRHSGVTGGEVYFVKYKDKSCVSGEFLRSSLKRVSLERASCRVKVVKNLFFRKGSVFVLFFLY